jgi:diguanylate cyclase (GGDEF)-like protein
MTMQDDERKRLEALYAYDILDSEPEPDFDRVARTAAHALDMPCAVLSLTDADRHWFKAQIGVPGTEMPRRSSFCDHTIRQGEPFVVLDAAADARFAAAPAVVSAPHVRFYAGAPLVSPDGFRIGSLCVLDSAPRHAFGAREAAVLTGLAATAAELLAARLRRIALSRQAREIARLAMLDPLTGLLNAEAFRGVLADRLLPAHARAGLALLAVDLDGFKHVNDTLGHAAGDALLRQVAHRLRLHCGDGDVLARMGGDEFAILHEAAGRPAVAAFAGDLVAALSRPYDIEGQQVTVGASLGVALAGPGGADHALVAKQADAALYEAKRRGKNRHQFFDETLARQMQLRHIVRHELAGALDRGEFSLVYQPVVDLRSGETVACEALLRWQHPVRGDIGPADFLDEAGRCGLIHALGDWTIAEACREAAAWPAFMRVAVNLSPVQFASGSLAERVAAILQRAGLDPRRLELELTEAVLRQEHRQTIRTLRELRALGARLALDDFGEGFSSLAHLRFFRFDQLKIARSMTRAVPTRQDCAAIVRALVGLARELGTGTTVTGVETATEMRHLRACGCALGQGYLFGRPASSGFTRVLLGVGPRLPPAPADRRRHIVAVD